MTSYINSFKETVLLQGNYNNKLELYKQSNQYDLKLRSLYVKERDNIELLDNYVGLISVHDNYEMFKTLFLSEEEKSQAVILTKDMDIPQINSFPIVTKEEFMNNYDIFTEGILECMNWDNLFLAGGSVLSMVSKLPNDVVTNEEKRKYYNKKYPKSDLDLYLYGLNEEQSTKKIYEIYENIKKVLSCDCVCIRSGKAVSIVSQYPNRHVQVIIRLHMSPAEVLHSFDIDSCSIGYDGKNIWCTSRAHYAITNKRNTVDLTRRSFSYEYRLKKYNERGYGVVIPNFDQNKVDYRIFVKTPSQVTGLARLLVLENINDNVKHNLYRDVLNMHQATMYKNISLSSTYEESDYTLVFLPWGPEWNAKKIKDHMKKKNELLNNEEVKYPRYLCFTGTIYEVVKDNNIKKPLFEDIKEEQLYTNKFTFDKIKWNLPFENDVGLLGSFNTLTNDMNDWYNDAYNINEVDSLCDNIYKKDKINTLNLIKKHSEEELIKILNSKDISCRNPLHMAITLNDIETCKLLLENGSNPMTPTKLNKNALHKACELGNLEITQLIMNYKNKYADFNTHKKDSYGLIPILYCIIYGHTKCFEYLFENTVENNASLIWFFKLDKSRSNRALYLCLLFKRYDIANYLLLKGYDIHDYYYQDLKTFKDENKNHIMKQAILNCDLKFVKLLIKGGIQDLQNMNDGKLLSEYKTHLQNESLLLNKIKTIKNNDQQKYFIDTLDYIEKLNGTHINMIELLHHFVTTLNTNLKYLLEKKYCDINDVFKNKTVMDIILEELNKLHNKKVEIKSLNKLTMITNQVNEKLNKKLRVISTSREASQLSIDEDNKWLVQNNKVKTNELKPIDKINEKINELETLKEYFLSIGGKSYNDINGILTTIPLKFQLKYSSDFTAPIYQMYFTDFDKNVMYRTDKYIELYNAIKNDNLCTIQNLTIKADLKEAIHLCVTNNRNYSPLDIALKYKLQLVPHLIEIMNMQMIKNKIESKKKLSKSKIYFDNKKMSKIQKKEINIEKKTLYGEEHLDINNKFAITNLGLDILFNKFDFISYHGTDFEALKILLTLNNDVLNKKIYENIEKYICDLINKPECLNLLINQYSKLLDEKKYKYKLADMFAVNLIIKTNSCELLNYFLNDCEKIWESKLITYPFGKDNIFSTEQNILHMLCGNTNNDKNFTNLISNIIKFNTDSINQNDYLNRSPMMVSIERKNINIFKILLNHQKGKWWNNRYQNGLNIMHMIITNNDISIFNSLSLEIMSDLLNSQTLHKLQTPLMIAIKLSHIPISKLMIEYNAKQNVSDIFGNTALHYAMMNSLYPIVNLLENHCKENYFRMTPQDYVINMMKSLFHHNRNDKIKSVNSKQLYYTIGIYNDFILNKESNREFTDNINIKNVNDYILSKIKNINDGRIPEELKV